MSDIDAPGATIPLVNTIAPMAAKYDAWLCDIWGVLHNGVKTFEDGCDACIKFREGGGVVILITNAPRPKGPVTEQFRSYGVPDNAWDDVITSGDVTRTLMVEWLSRGEGRKIYHLGPERDRTLFQDIDVEFAEIDAADIVINTGLFDDTTETPDDYSEIFARLGERGLQMICANPDIKVERGNEVIYCGGALAEAYAALGGDVTYAGKPHMPIYQAAFELMARAKGSHIARQRVLAIGDGIKTDMKGAAEAGIDSLFVPSAIHVDKERGLDADTLAELFKGSTPPIAAQSALKW